MVKGIARRLGLLSAAASLLVGFTTSSEASAAEPRKTAGGVPVRWAMSELSFELDATLANVVKEAPDALNSATGGWSGKVGAPALKTTLGAQASAASGKDFHNGVYFAKDGDPKAGQALAITVLTYDDKSGQVLDADVIVNGKYDFAVLGSDAVADANPIDTSPGAKAAAAPADGKKRLFDLTHVLAHESGHTLGLTDDSVEAKALMYRYSSAGDISRRAPTELDLQVLSDLYLNAQTAESGGCGGTMAPRGLNGSLLPVLFGAVVIVAFGRRRAHRAALLGVIGLSLIAVTAMPRVARSASPEVSDGQARIVASRAVWENGYLHTKLQLDVTSCRFAACTRSGAVDMWGGTMDGLTQVIGEDQVPHVGETVKVSFSHVLHNINPLAPIMLDGMRVHGDGALSIVSE